MAIACMKTWRSRRDLLERAIEDTVHAGGTLMIPTFAMERTQELLFYLHQLFEAGSRAARAGFH